jgi:phospholipid-binding lipoprotein MlaA
LKSIAKISSYIIAVGFAGILAVAGPQEVAAEGASPITRLVLPVTSGRAADLAELPVDFGSMAPIMVGGSLVVPALPQIAQARANIDDVNDPIEPVNRFIFGFNEIFLEYLLRPISSIYKNNLPQPVQKAVNNVLANLSAPVVFVNEILQGRPGFAAETVGRFVVNSTVGLGGIRDVAEDLGWSRQSEDFGQTLGVWGVGEGFYLVLPIFGPSSPRDAVGKLVVDSYFDAFNIWANNTNREYLLYSRLGVEGVDLYAGFMDELDEIKKTSIDYYAAVRSMYRQRREAQIRNGAPGELPPIPDISYDLPADGASR